MLLNAKSPKLLEEIEAKIAEDRLFSGHIQRTGGIMTGCLLEELSLPCLRP
jgi:hypothetical protein